VGKSGRECCIFASLGGIISPVDFCGLQQILWISWPVSAIKLRFIERHYAVASFPFREIRRKINDREEPFEPPPFDPDSDNLGEPPFLEEHLEATESLNIEGQAALRLVQSSLQEYLKSFAAMYGIPLTGKGSWLVRYKEGFRDAYEIDFDKAPVRLVELEEVVLARNDLEHGGEAFGMTRRQSKEHQRRFPAGLFVDEMEKQVFTSSHSWAGQIQVTEDNLKEAIRRVETFCEYLDSQRPY
jgi:hypothetical protein